uniref:Uncharacterized protein n=1 Tax=Yersinia enterocolitica TaxID=630 RepID=B0RKV9_YEREN|nr:hypothetical protein [Yersinia enterocolitica]
MRRFSRFHLAGPPTVARLYVHQWDVPAPGKRGPAEPAILPPATASRGDFPSDRCFRARCPFDVVHPEGAPADKASNRHAVSGPPHRIPGVSRGR